MQSVDDAMKKRRQPEEMLPLLKRHEIKVLRGAGHSLRDVAERAGVSVSTVRRVEREERPEHVDKKVEVKRRRIGRPSKAEPLRAFVVRMLTGDPGLMAPQ